VYAHNSPHEPIYEIIASKMQQKRGLKLAQTERVAIFLHAMEPELSEEVMLAEY
jgi:hypothetical protein